MTASFAYCLQQVRQFDNDRFVCSLFAPEASRKRLVALYAFNLEIASTAERVREPLLGRIRLQWWREALDQIRAGRPPAHPVPEIMHGAGIAELDPSLFERLIAAREEDLEKRTPPPSLEALIGYAEATSATLTMLALMALGRNEGAEMAAGRAVGIAWALIGLVRAVPFHARMGRCYLPADLLAAAGVDPARLGQPEAGASPGLRHVVHAVARAAAEHLKAAHRGGSSIHPDALPALLPATLAVGYLRVLERARFDPFAVAGRRRGAGPLLKLVLNRARGRF